MRFFVGEDCRYWTATHAVSKGNDYASALYTGVCAPSGDQCFNASEVYLTSYARWAVK